MHQGPSLPGAPLADAESLSGAAPLVLLGRGGSGTRLLAQLALPTGVFLGRLSDSFDSLEWSDLTYDLSLSLLADPRRVSIERAAAALRQQAVTLLAASGLDPGRPWGWKLPETMLILPAVGAAFPRAKYVHLLRHPVTSALRRTHMTSRTDNVIGRAVLAAAYARCGRHPALIEADPDHIRNAVTWRFQIEDAEAFFAGPAGVHRLELRYEALCVDPAAEQARLFAFVGRPDLRASPPEIHADRAGAYDPADERAIEVWRICGELSARLGYAFAP